MSIKDKYLNQANSFLYEDEQVVKEEDGNSPIKIFFDNLDEETQKNIMESLKESLNVAEDDEYANNKIIEILAKNPMVTIRTDELIRQMNFDI